MRSNGFKHLIYLGFTLSAAPLFAFAATSPARRSIDELTSITDLHDRILEVDTSAKTWRIFNRAEHD